VTPEECEARDGILVAGGEQFDVVYRRTDEDRLYDERGELTDVGALLDGALRAGSVVCLNAFGSGVVDDKLVHGYVEDMIRFHLGEEPLLRSVRTFDLAVPECREEALDRLSELVVKPRNGYGGQGVVVCPDADPDMVRAVGRAIRADPETFIAQDTVRFSRHPTVIDGALAPRHVDLRPYVVFDGERAEVLPGGLTRVAFGEDELVVNSSQDGGAKDTWVLP
jgi:carboxylate-amine ligase